MSTYILSICVFSLYIHTYMYVYIYVYIERERARTYMYAYIFIDTYICINIRVCSVYTCVLCI